MLISDSHQFIFVHIRKAAGTTVSNYLQPHCLQKPEDLISKALSRSGLEKDYRHFAFRKHAALELAQRLMPPETFDSYFKFAFVRNPWDRLVSEFEYIRRVADHSRHRRLMKMTEIGELIAFQRRRREAFQWHMLCDSKGRLKMDFVGRFENLQTDFDYICEQIGLEKTALGKFNATRHRDYREYYNKKTRDLVEKYWYREIEYFGYQFDDGLKSSVSESGS